MHKPYIFYVIERVDFEQKNPVPSVYQSVLSGVTLEDALQSYHSAHSPSLWTLVAATPYDGGPRGFDANALRVASLGVTFPFDGQATMLTELSKPDAPAAKPEEPKFDADAAMRAARDLCRGQAGARVWR